MKKFVAVLLCIALLAGGFFIFRNSILGNDTDTDPYGNEKALKNKKQYNFLVMGHDRKASLTDVMMLVSFDTENGNATVMQIPRDTYVEYEDYTYHKINGVYNHCLAIAKDAESNDPNREACKMTADFIAKTFNVKIHYSAIMDLDGFSGIVDAIGGVNMYVPYDMKYEDSQQNLYIDLKEGEQKLSGEQAEQFVRYRSGYLNADLGRGDAQKMFMAAFVKSFKDNVNVLTLNTVAKEIYANVITDISVKDMASIAFKAMSAELSDITMLTAPGGLASSYYVLNKESLAAVLNESFNIFEEEINADSVDADVCFSNEGDSAMMAVYAQPAEEFNYDKHNAEDVSKEEINVPLK